MTELNWLCKGDEDACVGSIVVDWDEEKGEYVVVERTTRYRADLIDFRHDTKGNVLGVRFRKDDGEWVTVPNWAMERRG
jgi:hypothetical protein